MATASASLVDLVERLRRDDRLGPQIVEALYLPAVAARFGDLDPPLPAPLAAALAEAGATRLWSHQAEGVAAVRRGEDLLLTTPTASGKSLVFQLPVLQAALAEEPGHALFLYPLKALGQDQKRKLDALAAAAGIEPAAARCEIYDGDTADEERARIRQEPPRVLITNPEMLHLGILAHWASWAPFLRRLRWLVLDELHTYRGIFGSHFHHVLARLERLAAIEGSRPTVVASSATAVNAGDFAAELTGRSFTWVADSGAPRQGRHFLLLRPDASPYTLALQLTERLLRAGLKTIVFTKARRITELLFSWLKQQAPDLAPRVANYRSGFLAEERREIEARLSDGSLDGVISTSALEMGVDIGGLDACVLVGFPGSVMATWERSGRVGRAERESITALVALPDALDQYLLDHPGELVERPCERLVTDPANEPIARAHLVCAAAERPLTRERDAAYLERHAPVVGELLRERELVEAEGTRELCTPRRRPQRGVSLRGSGEGVTIVDPRGRTIGTVDGVRVLHECHPGAIYLHWGRQFLVRELDLPGGKVHAEPVSLDYFTTPLTEKSTRVVEVLEERDEPEMPLQAFLCRLQVTERVVGYERKRIRGQEPIDRHELELPPVRFKTVGLVWTAPREIEEAVREEGAHFMGALHAAEHATISLLPLTALCDRNDIGGISMPVHPQLGCGCVFIYDGHPGGVGIAARGFAELPDLLGRVTELLERCPCEIGCPSCVQSPKCGNGNRPLDKQGAAFLLATLLGHRELRHGLEPSRVTVGPAPPEEEPAEASAVAPAGPPVREAAPAAAPERVSRTGPPWWGGAARRRRRSRDDRPEPLAGPPVPAFPRDTVLFDLETIRSAAEVGGWANSHRMRIAVGVALHLQEGRFEVFREDGVSELVAMLEAADAVVGFNVRRFDYLVLSGYTGIDYCRRLPTVDLFEEVERRAGFRIGLNNLAKATLGVEKSGDGLQSLAWVREGDLAKVEAYCRRDVEILRDLYLFGRRMGHLFYADDEGRRFQLEVSW
ncbi:MAG: DEAD/DEAH box helicase [Thermoanaerobaculia bacterium]|nr:DEAD/DEAH box helicase [Thermoanaerobaculia bacterium]